MGGTQTVTFVHLIHDLTEISILLFGFHTRKLTHFDYIIKTFVQNFFWYFLQFVK